MKKVKILSAILLVGLSVSLIVLGVYAARNSRMQSAGRIGFISNNVKAEIECFINGVSIHTETFTSEQNDVTKSWNIGELEFETNTENDIPNGNITISLSFAVTNNSQRNAYAYFVDSNRNIITTDLLDGAINQDVVSVTLTGVTEIVSGATETLEIVFTLNQNEFLRNDTIQSFAYSLTLNTFNPQV